MARTKHITALPLIVFESNVTVLLSFHKAVKIPRSKEFPDRYSTERFQNQDPFMGGDRAQPKNN